MAAMQAGIGQIQAIGQQIASTLIAITSGLQAGGEILSGLIGAMQSGIAQFQAIGQQIASTLIADRNLQDYRQAVKFFRPLSVQ